jgi:hypothetical protein
MTVGKQFQRIEKKLDALLEEAGLDPREFSASANPAQQRKLSAAEQEAIDNAPATPIASDIPDEKPQRVNTMNAPITPTAAEPSTVVGRDKAK